MLSFRQSLLCTLAFFDLFDYPLTLPEISRFLWRYDDDASLGTLSREIESLIRSNAIESRNGFFFLPQRAIVIAERERAVREVEKKMRIATRACKMLRWIPFIRSVFVCNTVAGGYAKSESDIDVFIIIRQGRIFLARLLATFALSAFRLRRTRTHIANRICLSFYATDNALALAPVAMGEDDVYLAYWLCQLLPLYDPDNMLQKIQQANQWILRLIPHGFTKHILRSDLRVEHSRWSATAKKLFEKMWQGRYGDLMESEAKAFETAHMKLRSFAEKEQTTRHVIVNDTMLKFHEHDRRQEFHDRWKKKMEEMI